MANLNPTELGLFYLFEKPSTPIYVPRASNTVVYNIPHETLSPTGNLADADRRSVEVKEAFLSNQVGVFPARKIIDIRYMTTFHRLPLSVRSIERGVIFSNFMTSHLKAARELIDIFMRQRSSEDLLSLAANIRDHVNEGLFIYCLSFVVIRRQDFLRVQVPSIVEMLPTHFIPIKSIEKGHKALHHHIPASDRPQIIPINHDLDFSGTSLNLEHRVSYWREDYGINSHHWHWHLVFPVNKGINRDRKGEMFFYMHSQMLARYDWERLSNGLIRVKPLRNFVDVIEDGYFSKLTVNNSNQTFGSRQDNTRLSDFSRPCENPESITVNDLEVWRQRLMDGIDQGFLIDTQGNHVSLSDDVDILAGNKRGVDILADSLEADPELSVNYLFYGNLHNSGHTVISAAHDPEGFHKENFGVMTSTATAMRDPVFYRLHKFVDDLFQSYKITQRPYGYDELMVSGIEVEEIRIVTGREGNILRTFYDIKSIEASRGLDFKSDTSVIVNLTRLNHSPFKYHFRINNSNVSNKKVTVRVYMAPKFNESGSEMGFMEQRKLWAEMDKFVHDLAPGSNHIQRESTQSSITIPEDLTFRELEQGDAAEQIPEAFCGCGWPQHMLVPRGTAGGMTFQLFVLLSDYELDKVNNSAPSRSRCGKAISYCGLLDTKFPDRRPMGFPFDRRPLPEISDMTGFANAFSNARMIDIAIHFDNNLRSSNKP